MSQDASPELRRQLELYAGLFAALPVPATLIDRQGIILDVNQAFLDYARRHVSPVHREDRIGRPIASFATRPEDRQMLEPLLERLFATGEPDQVTWRKPDRQGQLFYVELQGIPLRDDAGQLVGAALLRRDVTAERRQQQRQTVLAALLREVWAMHDSSDIEQVLSSIYNGLRKLGISFDACGISLIDADSAPSSVRCCNIDHDGRWVEETIQPESVAALLEIWKTRSVHYRKDLHGEDAFGEGEHLQNAFARPVRSVVDVPFSPGTLALNSARPSAFSDEDIDILREMAEILSSGFARLDDFRELEQRTRQLEEEVAERQRRELQQRARTQVRDAVWQMRSVDETDRLLDAFAAALKTAEIPSFSFGINLVDTSNPAPAVQFYNAGRKEWRGHTGDRARDTILEFWRGGEPVYRPDLDRHDPYQERNTIDGFFGTPVRSVVDIPFSHGTLALNSLQANAFSADDIAFLQGLANVLGEGFRRLEDIGRLQEQEKQLLQSQKMEVVGRLAGGVAHDFNNMLTAILGAGAQLLQECDPGDTQRMELELIRDAGQKAANLTRQLLAFSRQQVLQPRVLDLNELIASQVEMVQRLIGEDVELLTSFHPRLDRVEVDPNQIVQVLLNLAVNARDAMPEGGRLTIGTRNVEWDPDSPARQVPPGSYVQLSVSDTGHGMDRETLEHIFEPFFTTKESGKGTGLGLSTVYGIIKQSDGHIAVRSVPGQGTTFEIHLPRVLEVAPERQEDEAPALPPGSETVLVVEDDDLVRSIARRILEASGYTVFDAANGQEALQLGETHPAIRLLITDVVMPGMNGRELAERLLARNPALKVIYMSGYASSTVVQQQVLSPDTPFLQKPFDVKGLLEKVREALDSG